MFRAIPCVKLIFPSFFDQVASHDLQSFRKDLPSTAQLIDRGEIYDEPEMSIEQELLGNFKLSASRKYDLSIASMTAAADGIEYRPGLVRADPVHLRADSSQLRLFCGDGFEPSAAQSELLIDGLNNLFPEVKFIQGRHPSRWYLQLPQPFEFTTPSPSEINQKTIEGHLPSGSDAQQIHALLNEIQMALYQSEVNLARENDGQAPINSVWFWGNKPIIGEGCEVDFTVWGNDVLAYAVAENSGISFFDTSDVRAILGEQVPNIFGRIVLVNSPTGPISERDSQLDIYQFERVWAQPLIQGLRLGDINELQIIDTRRRLTIRRFDIWKLWRSSSYFEDKLSMQIDPSKLSKDISANDAVD